MAATRGQRWTLALQLSSFASLTSLVSYNAALNALSKSLKWSNTLALLMFAETTRMVLDYQALCVGLGAMSFRWRRALSIVRRSGQAESFLPVVVQALAAASESAQAIKLLRSARQSPGLVTFNAALRACKEANEALALLDDAQQASLQPTCVSLIAACSNTHGWHSRQARSSPGRMRPTKPELYRERRQREPRGAHAAACEPDGDQATSPGWQAPAGQDATSGVDDELREMTGATSPQHASRAAHPEDRRVFTRRLAVQPLDGAMPSKDRIDVKRRELVAVDREDAKIEHLKETDLTGMSGQALAVRVDSVERDIGPNNDDFASSQAELERRTAPDNENTKKAGRATADGSST
ncbi:unnamed protein product [Effrenium voratum]|nr:unnamed protein product [Effrenium voratum]